MTIPVKKWKDRGGGKGFGWVTMRTTRYQCRVKKNGPVVSGNSTSAEGLRSQRLREYSSDVGANYLGTGIQTGVNLESSGRKISER